MTSYESTYILGRHHDPILKQGSLTQAHCTSHIAQLSSGKYKYFNAAQVSNNKLTDGPMYEKNINSSPVWLETFYPSIVIPRSCDRKKCRTCGHFMLTVHKTISALGINVSLYSIFYLAVTHKTVYNTEASISWRGSWHLHPQVHKSCTTRQHTREHWHHTAIFNVLFLVTRYVQLYQSHKMPRATVSTLTRRSL